MAISESFPFNEKNSSSVVKIMEEEKAATAAVNWLELPEHLSFEIMAKLTCFDDYIRFGAVSVQWRSLFLSEYCPKLPPQPPLLIVPTPPPPPLHNEDDDEEAGIGEKKKKTNASPTRSCSFYSITDNKVYRQLQLAMPLNRHVFGSGHGWLITMDDDGLVYPIRLINPFFFPKPPCKEIELPSLSSFIAGAGHHFLTPITLNLKNLKKTILSADPILNPKDYIVMVIYGGFKKLAFNKPSGGDKEAWTLVRTEKYQGPFEDIIFYKDKFYALHHYGELFVCDLERRIAEKIVEPMPSLKPAQKKYLVESSWGDLLQVVRITEYDQNYSSHLTIGFKVFKLVFMDDPTGKFLLEYLDSPLAPAMDGIEEPEWMEVNDLYGCAIFVGYNGSLSVSAANFPGVKRNCIYYTNDDRERIQDIGLFNLEDGSIEEHYPTEMGKQILPPPIWIEPPQPLNIIKNKLIK